MKTNVGFLHRLDGKIEASAHGKPTFFFCIYVSLKGRPISCHASHSSKPVMQESKKRLSAK